MDEKEKKDERPVKRDEALWMILALRLLQVLIIILLWFFAPALIKALGF
jgi:hypothetical protein